MEVEVKLRLPDSSAHQKVLSLLSPYHKKTHHQLNTFFDGASGELSSQRAVLRLRFYENLKGNTVINNSVSRVGEYKEESKIGNECVDDPRKLARSKEEENVKCMVCLKGKAVIVNGVSRAEEDEEELDSKIGYECVDDPRKLTEVESSRVLKRAKEEFQVGEGGFIGLGGFRNERNVFEWNGVVLEVDETKYDFGTSYEIECESSEPEKVKEMIETLLKENGIDYSYSKVSKFATFCSGKLP
ncbi:Triphosphate tunel metalloenzyme 3 [Capsicum baccatum]|uniref:Triphosphate tunel metalloenzyme 3 n=1 Tax=Capsicum baccatum TaxID=33114 RepID=A0A2G2XIB7_CAPBA|nr:Triphosphate tunel metalloenzyme 3 [Capsicum baccatum]